VGKMSIGVQLSLRAVDWPSLLAAAKRVDELGYDHLWLPDHLLAGTDDASQSVFESYAILAAFAATTTRARLGLLVGANTFRNPAVVAKTIVTIDHISGGRAILGLGGGWQAREHAAYGLEFGRSAGDRLDWLDEALSIIRPLLTGEEVTHGGPHYRTDHLRLEPRPLQDRLPIMVGGSGERKTLRTVARYADMWSAQIGLDQASHKLEVLRTHCDAVGRDLAAIELTLDCAVVIRDRERDARAALERMFEVNGDEPPAATNSFYWTGTPEQIVERMGAFEELGFRSFTCTFSAPYDDESLVRLIEDVKPLVESR